MAGVHGSVGYGRRLRLTSASGRRSPQATARWSIATGSTPTASARSGTERSELDARVAPPDTASTRDRRRCEPGRSGAAVRPVLASRHRRLQERGVKWSARGGTYVYSDVEHGGFATRPGFRDILRQDVLITYEQHYSIPYIGLGAGWSRTAFRLETHLLFSPVVFASDSDNHVKRGVLFKGSSPGARTSGWA